MIEKEVSELRRQLRPDRSGISKVYGCYVNENRTIVSTFEQSLGLTTQEESEARSAKICSISRSATNR